MKLVYADCAATTRMCAAAQSAMEPFTSETFGNASSLHKFGRAARRALEKARSDIAGLIGAKPAEVIFTGGGTESDNWAIKAAAELADKSPVHFISSKTEHPAVLETLKSLRYKGAEITLLNVDKFGRVAPADVENSIKENTALISIMAANNETGVIQPVEEIGEIAASHNTLFHTDAVQAAGHIPINVHSSNIDLMSASAHKANGPKGVGILFIKENIKISPLFSGGLQERGKRAGTENVAAAVGMAAALCEAFENIERERQRLKELCDIMIKRAVMIEGVVYNGCKEASLPGIVNLTVRGVEGEALVMLLDMVGIAVSAGSACSSGGEASHVLLAMGRTQEEANSTIRLSFDRYTTRDDIDYITVKLPEQIKKLRDLHELR